MVYGMIAVVFVLFATAAHSLVTLYIEYSNEQEETKSIDELNQFLFLANKLSANTVMMFNSAIETAYKEAVVAQREEPVADVLSFEEVLDTVSSGDSYKFIKINNEYRFARIDYFSPEPVQHDELYTSKEEPEAAGRIVIWSDAREFQLVLDYSMTANKMCNEQHMQEIEEGFGGRLNYTGRLREGSEV